MTYLNTVITTVLLSLVVVAPVAHGTGESATVCGETTVTPGYTVTLCVEGRPTHTAGAASR